MVILSAVFGGTAAHAASEAEPDTGGSSLVGTLSSVVSSLTDPQAPDPQGLGADVAEPLDAVVSTLPIVPEIVAEAPVNGVTSSVLHTAERIVVVVPEIADAAAGNVSESIAPVTAPTVVSDSMVVDPSPVAAVVTATVTAASSPDDAGANLAISPLPLTPDQPTPVPDTTTTGASAGSAGAPAAGDLNSAGWSPLNEDAESPTAHNDRCPASATYDSDSTPD